jgi:3-dehydroquinate synthase
VKTIQVKTKFASYAVVCDRGALNRLGSIVDKLCDGGEVYALSSPKVWKFWGRDVLRALRGLPRGRVLLFDDTEVAKRLATVERICRDLARLRADRRSLLVAVGGGVVGDVAGFAAASYLRGVRVAHVPTTLVAQVDSAIGGKTAVDLPEGKNLVGAFHQPEMVIADPTVLRTLPARQFRSGLYEVIKYGVIGDPELFNFLERELATLLRMDMPALEFVIERGARQKARMVSKDERENGIRQLLNFGHTIGHALETLTRYKLFLHGEAVGWGMLGATQIAVATKRLSERDGHRIASLVARCGRLPELPRVAQRKLLQTIAGDKKSRDGKVGWVLPRKIGAADFGVHVADALVAKVWRDLAAFYTRMRGEI